MKPYTKPTMEKTAIFSYDGPGGMLGLGKTRIPLVVEPTKCPTLVVEEVNNETYFNSKRESSNGRRT